AGEGVQVEDNVCMSCWGCVCFCSNGMRWRSKRSFGCSLEWAGLRRAWMAAKEAFEMASFKVSLVIVHSIGIGRWCKGWVALTVRQISGSRLHELLDR